MEKTPDCNMQECTVILRLNSFVSSSMPESPRSVISSFYWLMCSEKGGGVMLYSSSIDPKYPSCPSKHLDQLSPTVSAYWHDVSKRYDSALKHILFISLRF